MSRAAGFRFMHCLHTELYIDVAEQRCSFPALKIPNWLNDADSQSGESKSPIDR